MIKVDRAKVPEPPKFAAKAREALDELQANMSERSGRKGSAQERIPFRTDVWLKSDLQQSLQTLFGGKCAFCESPLTASERKTVAYFRPRERAASLDGKVAALHYWWLAYEWTNLYAICEPCHSAKGVRFPVKGPRAQPADGAGGAGKEQALLLDPCRDQPEGELAFQEDGTVSSSTERGKITIDVFALNRMALIKARREICERVDSIGDAYLDENNPERWIEENFVAAVLAEAPQNWGYVAVTRAQARRHLARAQAQVRKSIGKKEKSSAPTTPPPYKPSQAPRPYQGAIWLRRIQIENFKAIRRLELEFPAADEPLPVADQNANIVQQAETAPKSQPWLMLLGENGVGKSSVLKAVALAMMNHKQLREYAGDPRAWVNRGSGARSGLIRVEFTVGAEPIELHFSRRASQCTRRGEHPNVAVLGYGSTRLLPPKGRRARAETIRVQNLFDSRAPLRDAEPWLASTADVGAGNFDLLASSLKTLLSLADEDRIARRQARLFTRVNGDYGPIRDLSDGYQSVLALALDMMFNLSKATFDMEAVEGVVLLDELEIHLHARWKIAIVGALRMLFPRVRFIATTHDPLCVQGIRKGELHIMTRQGADHDVKIEQFDVPPGARADQILTGAWFGVPTTRDPETVSMMREHSTLLQKRGKSLDDEFRFDYLDKQLRHRLDEYIGTEDEQIALQAAAEVRSENRQRTGGPGATGADDLREKVLEALRAKQPEIQRS